MRKEIHKLVRDNIPTILDTKNVHYSYHQADSDEYLKLLLEKVNEEATELQKVVTNPHGAMDNTIASEIGDLYEVLDALTIELGLDPDRIGDIQSKKAEAKGRFFSRIVLDWIEPNFHSTK